MPHYFFNVQNAKGWITDDVGADYNSLEDARAAAVVASGEMLRDKGAKFWPHGEWRMHVTDEVGALVCKLRFAVEH